MNKKTTTSSSLSSSGIYLILPFPEKGNTLIIVQVPYGLPYPTLPPTFLQFLPVSTVPFWSPHFPQNRQHPIPLHPLLTKRLDRHKPHNHNPCIGHHSSLYFTFWQNERRTKGGVDVPFFLKIQALPGWEGV